MNNVHFSSENRNWGTPQAHYEKLNAAFGPFDLDAAADIVNAKCDHYYTEKDDCLSIPVWDGERIFLNPPYGNSEEPCVQPYDKCKKKRCQPYDEKTNPKGRGYHIDTYVPGIEDFVRKAWEQSTLGKTVVCVLPARTDTDWFHRYIFGTGAEVRFLPGRLKFELPGGSKNSAPFPSVDVIFHPEAREVAA